MSVLGEKGAEEILEQELDTEYEYALRRHLDDVVEAMEANTNEYGLKTSCLTTRALSNKLDNGLDEGRMGMAVRALHELSENSRRDYVDTWSDCAGSPTWDFSGTTVEDLQDLQDEIDEMYHAPIEERAVGYAIDRLERNGEEAGRVNVNEELEDILGYSLPHSTLAKRMDGVVQ